MVWMLMIIAIQLLGMGEFGDGAASYELQPLDSANSNGFCPGRVAFNCIGQEAPIILDWFINGTVAARYLFEGTHEFPRNVNTITELQVNVSVTIVNANGSSTTIYITSTLEGSFNDLNGATVQCGRDSDLSETIYVKGHVPDRPNVTVTTVYDDSNAEIQVKVFGGRSSCSGITYSYLLQLMNASGSVVASHNISCQGGVVCNVVFPIAQDYGLYTVEVIALNNEQNIRSSSFMSDLINVTETREQLNVTSSPCLTSITCHTVSSGTCDVTLSGDNIDMISVNGPVNNTINLPPELQGSSSIKYVARFNSSFINRGNFTGNYPARLSSENAALMAIGVLLCFLSIILLVVEAAVILKRVKIPDKLKNIFILTTAIWLFIVSIDVILWITTAAIVAPRQDTCDEEWQKNRDNLVFAAFVFALISLLPSLQLLLVFYSREGKGNSKGKSEIEAKKEAFGMKEDLSGTPVDAIGRTPYENNLSTGGHRLFGESARDGHMRVSEEVSNIVKTEVKAKEEQSRQISSNTYDNLNQVGSKRNIEINQQTKGIPPDTQMYSSLDRRKPGKNSVAPDNSNEYSELKHNTGAQGPATTNFQGRAVIDRRQNVAGVKEEYGQLDPSQMGENVAPNLNPRGGGQGSGDNFNNSTPEPTQKKRRL